MAFYSHSRFQIDAPLRAFERAYNGVQAGFDALLLEDRASQNSAEIAGLSYAIVPVPGSYEFSSWSQQFGALTNTKPDHISELFAVRARTACRRLEVIRGHLIHGHMDHGGGNLMRTLPAPLTRL